MGKIIGWLIGGVAGSVVVTFIILPILGAIAPLIGPAIVIGIIIWIINANKGKGKQSNDPLRVAKRREGEYSCPSCRTAPPIGDFWFCGKCSNWFDACKSRSMCPHCGKQFASISCPFCTGSFPIDQWSVHAAANATYERESAKQANARKKEQQQRTEEESGRSEQRRAQEFQHQQEKAKYEEKQQRAEEDKRRRYEQEKQQSENANAQKDDRYYGKVVLGLTGKGITKEDVKRRYRELSLQYHPDTVNHAGPKIKELAEKEMKKINEAYAYFEKKYGL